jgi:hypothetical protein
MLQWLYMYVASVCFKCFSCFKCCKCFMFQMFQLFQMYATSVLSGCCIYYSGYTHMLQEHVLNVSSVSTYVASVP